jgi:hypothetical protein
VRAGETPPEPLAVTFEQSRPARELKHLRVLVDFSDTKKQPMAARCD